MSDPREFDTYEDATDDSFIETGVAGDFAGLTLAQVAGQLLRAPVATIRALLDVAADHEAIQARGRSPEVESLQAISQYKAPAVESALHSIEPVAVDGSEGEVFEPVTRQELLAFGLQVVAFVLAVIGGFVLAGGSFRREVAQLHQGAPFLIAGLVLWLVSEGVRSWPGLRAGAASGEDEYDAPPSQAADVNEYESDMPFEDRYAGVLMRASMLVLAAVLAVIAWNDTAARNGQINQFRPVGTWAWLASIVVVTVAFAPADWDPLSVGRRFVGWVRGLRMTWTVVALVFIVVIGAYFRLVNLEGVPPEMTSDHIEKILDSQRVVEGGRDVFFANNGGREPFQMYAMALFTRLPGLEMNFTALKLLAVIEGLLTLPVLWWMGCEVIGEDRRRFGNVTGLVLAGLVAVSYWHVAITRLALRIVLMPLVTALLVIFLSRGMRRNQRGDFLMVGLILGFSLYTYQAARMLPVVVVAGVVIAVLFRWRQWAEIKRYAFHLGIVVVVSFVMFVPMFRYSMDFPEQFWMRTAGRLFGDDVIIETNANGDPVQRDATIEERWQAFEDNLPVLTRNIRNALLMFNWKGDVAWINGAPNEPALDPFSGALLIVGLGAWLALMIRRRDPVIVLVPVMILIMILPSALSIAAPLENPSATRMSGSLPEVYLLAALPLALMVLTIRRLAPVESLRTVLPVGVVGVVFLAAFVVNSETYLDDYRISYGKSWPAQSVPADILRDFAESDEGSYGNAFIVGYEHWLDHRIVGLEAGATGWVNAIADPDNRLTGIGAVPDYLNDAWRCMTAGYPYPLDPGLDFLFFYRRQDERAAQLLVEWFPDGVAKMIDVAREGDDFYVYRVPAMGIEAFDQWLREHTVNPGCPA